MGLIWDDTGAKGKRTVFNPRPKVPKTGWKLINEFPCLKHAKVICFDVETTDPDIKKFGPGWGRGVGHIIGLAVGTDDGFRRYYPIRHTDGPNCDPQQVLDWASVQLGREQQAKLGHNIIYDLGWLEHEGVHVKGDIYDTWTAEKMLNHYESAALEDCGQRHLGEGKSSSVLYDWAWQMWGKGTAKSENEKRELAMSNLAKIPPSLVGHYAESDVVLPLQIAPIQFDMLEAQGMWDVYRMECDLIPLLVQMRLEGVSVNLDAAEEAYDKINQEIGYIQKRIDIEAGRPINSGSPIEVGLLFDRLGVEYPRTKKTNAPSFKGEFLKTVEHPVAAMIVEIEELKKMNSTFIKGYILESSINNKIHCTFKPMTAVTGRMSCVADFTPVMTKRGVIRMDEVCVGDFVWTHKGRWKKVLTLWRKGISPMVRLEFSDGNFLTCTTAHEVLLLSGEWKTVEQLLTNHENVNQPSASERSYGHQKSSHSLPRSKDAVGKKCSRRIVYHQPHSVSHSEDTHGPTRILCAEAPSVCGNENGRPQPDEGKIRRGASWLARRLRGWLRLSNTPSRGETLFRSPNCDGTGARYLAGKSSCETCCSSYRWQSEEQQPEQFVLMHRYRTQDDSRAGEAGHGGVTLKEIIPAGSREVYDVEVEEDHSYYACGVFSHNSADPNLQNVPSRTELAKVVRKAFVPDFGHDHWRKYDYSSIESRILAHYAVGAGSKELRKEYRRNPDTDYHTFTHDMIHRVVGLDLPRKHVKNVNFAGIYGASERKLQSMMGLSDEEATLFFAAYHDSLPYVKETMKAASNFAEEHGYTETITGRRATFDLWEPKYTDWGKPKPFALPFKQAVAEYGPNIKRAHLHKSLNYIIQGSAADLIKSGMVKCWKDGIYAETGVPRLVVHDETDFSVAPGWNDEAFKEMVHVMETAIKFRIPIKMAGDWGPNWGTCEEIK